MNINRLFVFLIFLFGVIHSFSQQNSTEKPRDEAINFFIDCFRCDMDYIRREIPYVNYVRDVKEADLYLRESRQTTGSGGREYTYFFSLSYTFGSIYNNVVNPRFGNGRW